MAERKFSLHLHPVLFYSFQSLNPLPSSFNLPSCLFHSFFSLFNFFLINSHPLQAITKPAPRCQRPMSILLAPQLRRASAEACLSITTSFFLFSPFSYPKTTPSICSHWAFIELAGSTGRAGPSWETHITVAGILMS